MQGRAMLCMCICDCGLCEIGLFTSQVLCHAGKYHGRLATAGPVGALGGGFGGGKVVEQMVGYVEICAFSISNKIIS